MLEQRPQMRSRNVVFWEVDTQADFMLPDGKLYVPGAEKLLPNLRRLVDAARQDHVLLVSDACEHTLDDPEFQTFPPHCVRGTPGARIVSEGLADRVLVIPNLPEFQLPPDAENRYQQLLLEKQTLNVFDNPHAAEIVERLGADVEFVVFGVVTEYCVRFAAKELLERRRRVALVRDAIETLKKDDGDRTIAELKSLGASLINTDEALSLLGPSIASVSKNP